MYDLRNAVIPMTLKNIKCHSATVSLFTCEFALVVQLRVSVCV